MYRAIFGLIIVCFCAVAAAADGWSGKWDSRWRGGGATLEMTQNGDRVTGAYPLYNGRIEGKVVGRQLIGEWIETQKTERRGKFEFTLSPDGDSFAGMFESGEWWNGTRIVTSRESPYARAHLGSPRDTLKSFLIAGELNRAGQFEHVGAMIACIDYGPGGADLFQGQKGALAELLFNTLDQGTLRVWDVPGAVSEAQLKVPVRQGEHRYHARAFLDRDRAPAWDRIKELRAKLGRSVDPASQKELEQKFRILFSAAQAAIDFAEWTSDGHRHELPVAILFVDIDKFKSLNSQFGETVVDQSLLPEVQRVIEKAVRHRGCAYREGGEEFVIALPNQTLADGAAFAQRLRAMIGRRSFGIASRTTSVTVSVGVAAFPEHGTDLTSVRRTANLAEHRAKKAGGNCVVVAEVPAPS